LIDQAYHTKEHCERIESLLQEIETTSRGQLSILYLEVYAWTSDRTKLHPVREEKSTNGKQQR
jgi:hypothetical protein